MRVTILIGFLLNLVLSSGEDNFSLESTSCVCTTVPCPVPGENYLTEGGGGTGDYYYILHGNIPVVSSASVQITQANLDKGTDTTSCTQQYSRNMDDVSIFDLSYFI
jgi:hypothetical protein